MLKKQRKKLIFLGTLSIALCALVWIMATQEDAGSRPAFPTSTLVITRADGTQIHFKVEVATTPEEQAYGLMFVHSLSAHTGMIFPYTPPRQVAFWMKNTLIPLDMLFVHANGEISHIVANTKPQSLLPVPSQTPIIAVIEIGGGEANANNIAVGDAVTSPVLTLTP